VICSHARFTYNEVAAILTNTRGPEAAKREERVADLLNLNDVYRALLKERARRGAIDFETTETQIVCDESGRIEKIVPRIRNDAHRLIEEAMLAANVCAADFITGGKHPSLYRVHEGPTPEKRVALQSYLRALGLGLHVSDDPTPAEFQAISQATQGRVDALQIHTMLLRSMQQAIYTATNSGHFGLAYEAYTHFTSPIRRYPDLLVHRVIKALLGERRYSLISGATEPAGKHKKGALAEQEQWEAAGVHCSTNERRADEASRDVEAWLKCRYMREHLGEEFGGTVSAVTSFGLFVQLDGLYVEGLVHITELGGEYFRFEEVRQELRGERSGVRYVVGSRVRVQVSRVDLDGRKIDFRLVEDDAEQALLMRARRDKFGDKPDKGAGKQGKSAVAELAAVKNADRALKASGRARGGAGVHPVRAAKAAARKGASGKASKRR
jgi:ribonuclease R